VVLLGADDAGNGLLHPQLPHVQCLGMERQQIDCQEQLTSFCYCCLTSTSCCLSI